MGESAIKIWAVFVKTLRESCRDWLVLALSLVFSPFFVFCYWLFTAGGSTTYTVLIIDQDRTPVSSGAMAAIAEMSYADGRPLLKVRSVSSAAEAERLLRNREGVAFILLEQGFGEAVAQVRQGSTNTSVPVTFGGDLTNPTYMLGSILATTAIDSYLHQQIGRQPLVAYNEAALGGSGTRSEFETYVPGLLVFAVIMLLFQSSMMIAREVEARTWQRLRLTQMRPVEYLAGLTAALSLVGMVSMLIALGSARLMGFESEGPLWVALLVAFLTSVTMIGAGFIVARFSRNSLQAFLIANFPLGVYMFFSGSIFPLPHKALFSVAGRGFALVDLLPPTHAVVALNKIFTLGAGLQDIFFELGMLALLALLTFALGVWLFARKNG